MWIQSIYCCNTSPCSLNDTTIICNHGSMKKQDEKCQNECPTGEFQSLSTISSIDICSKLEEEDKCYSNLYNNEFKAICHKISVDDTSTRTNVTSSSDPAIMKFCGKSEGNLKDKRSMASYICPQIAKSKYSYQQCYHQMFGSQER